MCLQVFWGDGDVIVEGRDCLIGDCDVLVYDIGENQICVVCGKDVYCMMFEEFVEVINLFVVLLVKFILKVEFVEDDECGDG